MTTLPVLTFESPIISETGLSPNTKEYVFSVPDTFDFVPGQFVMLEIINDDNKPLKRAFSIASSPAEQKADNTVSLCIKILPDGRLTHPLSLMKLNDTVKLQGPYGKFVLQNEHSKNLLFVAAGTGIAPLRSMIRHLLETSQKNPITLVFGFHGPEDYLYQQELEELQQRYEQFNIISVCSTPDSSWKGKTGYVQDVLRESFADGSDYDAYLCGPPKMVAETVALLAKQGFKKIFREAWG